MWTQTSVNLKVLVFSKVTSLKFIQPKPNCNYNCRNLKGIRLINSLRLGLSHLCEHKFKLNFQDYLNPSLVCK